MKRRGFLGASISMMALALLRPRSSLASEVASRAVPAGNEGKVDYDRDLRHLARERQELPQNPLGYYSSFHGAAFLLEGIDLEKAECRFLIAPSDGGESFSEDYEVIREHESLLFRSADGKRQFRWVANAGFYACEGCRMIELCQPVGAGLEYNANVGFTVPLDHAQAFNALVARKSLWQVGVVPSPLAGFEGFCEEILTVDASPRRDAMMADALDHYLNTIPFGLAGLKVMAKASPKAAAKAVEWVLPKALGWMMGPIQNPEPGKIELLDCPYRKRLGTSACEATCGHALAKYFTENVGVPMRMDPTVGGYTKCHVLIGAEQCTK